MKTFAVDVIGRPAPQGSKHLGEHGQVREQSPYLAAWRGEWRGSGARRRYVHGAIGLAVYRKFADLRIEPASLPLFDGPVRLSVGFFQASAPTEPPDLDKLVRAVGDALTICRVFGDDSQVVELWADKRSAGPEHAPGAFIVVNSIEPVRARSTGRLTVRRVARLHRRIPRG